MCAFDRTDQVLRRGEAEADRRRGVTSDQTIEFTSAQGRRQSWQRMEPTRLEDGGLSICSKILKLDLRAWRGDDHPTLRFFDPASGSYLLSAEEQAAQAERQQRESEQTIAALQARIADLEAQRGA